MHLMHAPFYKVNRDTNGLNYIKSYSAKSIYVLLNCYNLYLTTIFEEVM
jgi:hypothetical protein